MSEPLVPRLGRASSALQLARFLLDQLTWYLSGYVFIAIHELFTHMFGKWGLDRRTQAKIGPLRFLVGRIKISHKCRRDVLLFCRLTTCNWRSQTFWLNCNTSSATPCTFFPFSFPGTALFALRRFLRRGVRIFGTHRPGEVRCGLETMVKPWNQNSLHRYARCPSGCLCQLKLGAGHANRAKGSGSGKEKLGCLVLSRCYSWSIQWETINLVTCSSLTTGFTVASPSCKVPGTPHTTFWKHKSQKTHPHQWSSCQWVDQQYLSQKMSLE